MTKQAFVMLTASRVEHGEIRQVAGALQQETRLYGDGEQCVCVLLVTYPAGSPEWERWAAAGRAVDGAPKGPQLNSISSDNLDEEGSEAAFLGQRP
jgi:hypothetical protein